MRNRGFTKGGVLSTGPVQIGPSNPAYSGGGFESGGNPVYNTYVDNYSATIESGGYTISDTPGESFLLVGQGNVLSGSDNFDRPVQGAIIVGVNNVFEVPSNFRDGTAVFGGQNTIGAGAGYGSLIAGRSNTISGNSYIVCLGSSNTTNSSTWGVQVIGSGNTLTNTSKSAVIGTGNTIVSGWNGTAAIGNGNSAYGGGTIAAGYNNVASGSTCYLLGSGNKTGENPASAVGIGNLLYGQSSYVLGTNNSVALDAWSRELIGVGRYFTNIVDFTTLHFLGTGGSNIATSKQSGAGISHSSKQFLIGSRGEVQSPNSIVFSNVSSNYDVGAMQEVKTFLSCETTDATPTTVESNIFPKSDSAMGFSYTVTARRTDVDGHNVYWTGSGLITNEAGTVAIIGSVSKTEVAKVGFASVDIAFTEDVTNDSLQLTVTGEAGESITWHAVVTQNIVVG